MAFGMYGGCSPLGVASIGSASSELNHTAVCIIGDTQLRWQVAQSGSSPAAVFLLSGVDSPAAFSALP